MSFFRNCPSLKLPRPAGLLPAMAGMLLLAGCETVPLYHGTPISTRPPRIEAESSVVLFSFIAQKAAYATSQGTEWIVGESDDDALKIRASLEQILSEKLHLKVVPADRIINLRLYTDGMFPMRIPYYRNPLLLPVITNAREEEMMLRTGHALDTEYYATASATYHVSKYLFAPAKITVKIQWNLYSSYGPIYSTRADAEERALPYGFSFLPSGTMEQYQETMKGALDRAMAKALEKLGTQVTMDLITERKQATPEEELKHPVPSKPGAEDKSENDSVEKRRFRNVRGL